MAIGYADAQATVGQIFHADSSYLQDRLWFVSRTRDMYGHR